MAFKDLLTNFATTVGGRANNAIENGKLGLKINGEERKIAEYTLHIGDLIVEKLDAGEAFDDEIAALYASIQASRDVIAAARAEIEVNKQELEALKKAAAEPPEDPVCPACGTLLSADANFCPQCGAKVEVDPAPEPEPAPAPEPEPAACPECGAPVKEEDKFCEQCGTPVGAAEPAPEAPAEAPAEVLVEPLNEEKPAD